MIEYKWIDIEKISYKDALYLQKLLQEKVINDNSTQYILTLMHNDVITTGKRGFLDNLNYDKDFYLKNNIELIKTDRGGLTTYHGDGQLVVYFIFNLADFKLGIKKFVSKLEDVIIHFLKKRGILANKIENKRGIFIGKNKICAIGLHVSHNVTSHGFALNITTDLEKFNLFTPCGLKDCGVTSLEKINNLNINLKNIKEEVLKEIEQEFNINFT